VAPSMAMPVNAAILVGMGGFFAGVARVPIASLIMVAEMSGSYSLLVPMMLVSSITFLLNRGVSLYEAQVPGRVDSPAHLGDFQVDILERLSVADLMEDLDQDPIVLDSGMPFREVVELVFGGRQSHFPVVDDHEKIVGLLSVNEVRSVMATPEVWDLLVAGDMCVDAVNVAFVLPSDDLHTVMRHFTALKLDVLPVLEHAPPSPVIGLVQHHDVMQAYDKDIHRLRQDD